MHADTLSGDEDSVVVVVVTGSLLDPVAVVDATARGLRVHVDLRDLIVQIHAARSQEPVHRKGNGAPCEKVQTQQRRRSLSR
jgi:hypothetical protein